MIFKLDNVELIEISVSDLHVDFNRGIQARPGWVVLRSKPNASLRTLSSRENEPQRKSNMCVGFHPMCYLEKPLPNFVCLAGNIGLGRF